MCIEYREALVAVGVIFGGSSNSDLRKLVECFN